MIFYIGYEDGVLYVETDMYHDIKKIVVETINKTAISKDFYPIEILAEQTEPKQGTDCTQVDWKDEMWAEAVKDEPQTDAYDSAKFSHNCIGICENPMTYIAKAEDEQQTECAWKKGE